jgi:hypothetical protein
MKEECVPEPDERERRRGGPTMREPPGSHPSRFQEQLGNPIDPPDPLINRLDEDHQEGGHLVDHPNEARFGPPRDLNRDSPREPHPAAANPTQGMDLWIVNTGG